MNSEHKEKASFKSKKILIPISLVAMILFLVNYTDSESDLVTTAANKKEAPQEIAKTDPLKSNRRVASKPRQRQRPTVSPSQALTRKAKQAYNRIQNDPVPEEDFLYDQEEKTRNKNNQENSKDVNTLNPNATEATPLVETKKSPKEEKTIPEEFQTPSEAAESSDNNQEIAQSFVGNNNQANEDEEDNQEQENSEETSQSKVNQAPTISADKVTLSVEEEKTDSIKVTGNDPENIYIDFTPVGMPAFITPTRNGNDYDLAIAPLFGDSGTYNFQVIASDDQGLSATIDLEVVVSKYIFVVNKLQLVNSMTDTILGDLNDGQTIDLDVVGDQLNIVADVPFAGSVKFDSSDAFTNTENDIPYAYRLDTLGDYHNWTPVVGPLTITVTPYELDNEGGAAGTPYVINLNIIDSNP